MGDASRALLALLALAPAAFALGRHLGRGMRPSERVLLATALAPVALALPAFLIALAARVPLAPSLWQTEFLWMVVALWPARRVLPSRSHREPRPERGQGFPSVAVLAIGVCVLLVVLLPPWLEPVLRLAGDVWFHAAEAIEIRLHGLPPQDPTFAGTPLHRAWLPPFLLALLGAATGASPFHLQMVFGVWAAVITSFAGAHLAYRLFGRTVAVAAGAIVPLGLNPIGWALWLGRRGADNSDAPFDKLMELAGVFRAPAALAHGFAPADASLLMRFWGGCEQSLGLVLVTVLCWGVVRGFERRGGPAHRPWIRTFVMAAALLLWSPSWSGPVFGTLIAGWAFAGLTGRFGSAASGLLALGAASVVVWPYLRLAQIPGRAAAAVALGWNGEHARALAAGIGPWWAAALPAAMLAWQHGPGGRFAVGATLAATVSALVAQPKPMDFDLAVPVVWLWTAPLAAGGFVWWCERLRMPIAAKLSLAAILIVPTPWFLAVGIVGEGRSPGALVRPDEPGLRALPLATRGEQEAYAMLRERMPGDVVVIEAARVVVNQPVPLLAERRQFFPPYRLDLARGYGSRPTRNRALIALREELEVRRGIQHALFDSGVLDPGQHSYLHAFGAPIVLLVRSPEVSPGVWDGFRQRPEWTEFHANPEVRVYRFQGRGF
ncbi:MAG TPA: hypothetical protein VEY91_03515 [Candidatus Limnocylindria bacterium]|nr:hypothetical protein [Candidatus Limnocylindria bacterium]